MSTLEVLGYTASLVMGLVLGLTGGGGSILAVPILVYLFGIEAIPATSYSLGVIGAISLWGAWGAFKTGDLKLSEGLLFAIPGIFGVIASRRFFLPMIPDSLSLFQVTVSKNSFILIAFAILMLSTSISMLKSLTKKKHSKSPAETKTVSKTYLIVIGLAVGITSGFVGAGGGFLIVPALLSFGKLEMRKAVGTSLFIIGLNSSFGILSDLNKLDSLNPYLFFKILILAIIGMTLGMKIRASVSDAKLKLAFALMVLVIAGFILKDQIVQMQWG